MEHINRTHGRTFSLNVFRMNAQELIEITRRVSDSDEGLRLMSQNNREAGKQIHREVNRRLHNFVAASLTLIEHTRVFMRERYTGTVVFELYQAKVAAEFSNEPLARFLQDLRNYMLHKGLPESTMFLAYESNPQMPDGGGELTTGIRYNANILLAWDGWKAPAKTFIENAGEYVDIHAFVDTYTDKVILFHEWLQNELDRFHAEDLAQLQALQYAFAELDTSKLQTVPPSSDSTPDTSDSKSNVSDDSFEFAQERAAAIDTAGTELLRKVRKIQLPGPVVESFASDRPIAVITDDMMLETPLFWGYDVEGRHVFVFIRTSDGAFGLDENVFAELRMLVESVLKTGWAAKALSRTFIEKGIIRWIQSSFHSEELTRLSNVLATESRKAVQAVELWAPIAHLEVQARFAIGGVEIAPITKAMIDTLEAQGLSSSPTQQDQIRMLFDDLRKQMQGLAAVVIKMEAEPERAQEEGAALARTVVGLLRFFSPAAATSSLLCATALLGTDLVPTSSLLVLGDDIFSYSTLISPNVLPWRISEDAVLKLLTSGLTEVGRLVRPEGLSAFALAIRSSLLLYSTGTTLSDPVDRIVYTLSSLEGVLLKHAAEPAEFNVGQRMSLLLTHERAAREDVERNVREAYRLRARHGASPLTPHENASLATFVRNSYMVLRIALTNINSFKTLSEFVLSIDQLKNRVTPPNS